MNHLFKTIFGLGGIFLLAKVTAFAEINSPVAETEYVRAQLIAEVASIVPGQPFRVGLRLMHAPKWHTYWKSTATGYAPSLEWNLPGGWSAAEFAWPVPDLYSTDFSTDFVYYGDIVLPVTLTPPADLTPGTLVTLSAQASWLMCDDVCIPADRLPVSLRLPVSQQQNAVPELWTDLFAAADHRAPRAISSWSLSALRDGESILLTVLPPRNPSGNFNQKEIPDPGELYFFSDNALIEPSPTQEQIVNRDGSRTLFLKVSKENPPSVQRLTGVLKAAEGWFAQGLSGKPFPALAVDLPITSGDLSEVPDQPVSNHLPSIPPATDASITGASPSLGGSLFLAFLGGLILNLMPCVFPVIGIKIMGFVSQADADRRKISLHGIVFAVGVVVSFWTLVGVFLALRSAGESLGWGFQLQSAAFVYFMTAFILLFALNMSGVFEVGQKAMGLGQNFQQPSGLSGSFMSGVLATVVATPCSAPFLGTALGAAIAKPPAEMFLIFTFVAIGLATPYLILSLFPQWVTRLPRPGAWMESFKQGMAFLLYATAVYLAWVLAGQVGNEQLYGSQGLLKAFLAFVGVAFAAWIYGRWTPLHRPPRVRRIGFVFTVAVLLGSLLVGYPQADEEARQRLADAAAQISSTNSPSAMPAVLEGSQSVFWDTWEPGKAEALSAAGHTVYVDFTARWCVTCQTNKAAVFSSSEVLEVFRQKKIIALKADWTNRDPRITEALRSFRKAAVPFNLIFSPSRPPVELPAVLTPGIVLQELDQGM